MKKGKQQSNKTIKKSRLSHMTSSSIKNQKQRQKICNLIKNSSLKKKDCKIKFHNNTSKDIKNNQIVQYGASHPPSSRRKINKGQKSIRSSSIKQMCKSMPLNHTALKTNKQKYLEFPFQAIKFKQKYSHSIKNKIEINSDNNRINRNSLTKQNINTSNNKESKTHQNFYIQYDQPQQEWDKLGVIDTKILDNSKKIVNSYNQRLSRYNNQNIHHSKQYKDKSKNKKFSNTMTAIETNNNKKIDKQFQDSIFKLFRLIDSQNKGNISNEDLDKNKLPEATLYFLGGVFQKIREKQLIMTHHDFFLDCSQVYKRSSKQDIDWFINQIQILRTRINIQPTQKHIIKESIQSQKKNFINNDSNYQKQQIGFPIKISQKQPKTVQQIREKYKWQKNDSNYSFSFDNQQSSVISFRKKQNNGKQINLNQTHGANLSDDRGYQSTSSYQSSAKFYMPNQSSIDSLGYDRNNHLLNQYTNLENILKQNQQKKNKYQQKNRSETQSIKNFSKQEIKNQNDCRQSRATNSSKAGEIRKNILSNKAQDLRQQIYSRLQKMKITQDIKQQNIMKQNFINNTVNDSKNHQNSIKLYKKLIDDNNTKIKINQSSHQFNRASKNISEHIQKQQFNSTTKVLSENKIPLKQITKLSNTMNNIYTSNDNKYKVSSSIIQSQKEKYLNMQQKKQIQKQNLKQKQSIITSNSKKWQSNSKNCQNAYNDIQKLRQQFNKHKQIVQKRQKQKQNYFSNQLGKLNTKISQPNGQSRLQHQQESRIVKIFENKEFFPEKKQNKANNENYNSRYEKNIDRLSSLLPNSSITSKLLNSANQINFKNSSYTTSNLKDSINSSCRKSIQITLPMKYDAKRCLSQKKTDYNVQTLTKLDKIDQLSNKISQYLKKNAQKIQVSQHFTHTTGRFNDIFA